MRSRSDDEGEFTSDARTIWTEMGLAKGADGAALYMSALRGQQAMLYQVEGALRPLSLSFARVAAGAHRRSAPSARRWESIRPVSRKPLTAWKGTASFVGSRIRRVGVLRWRVLRRKGERSAVGRPPLLTSCSRTRPWRARSSSRTFFSRTRFCRYSTIDCSLLLEVVVGL
jgi:hypothetical protein